MDISTASEENHVVFYLAAQLQNTANNTVLSDIVTCNRRQTYQSYILIAKVHL